ncbi:MAG: LLM class flavin-dependent oxidoreductase [Chloroflexi bacterium]|nr:LLM class flavin-dependent oxidoreductase [Chloroflexota bacterium]
MDVGMTLTIRNYPAIPEPLSEIYQRGVEDAVYGEGLGFDFAWISEHHFAPDAWSPSVLPVLAHIAARTSRLELGTNLFLLPFHHPLRVAEDVATVDLLSNGRLTGFAVGSGSIEDEFETYNIRSKERWGRLFESLHIIRESFEHDVYNHAGKYFQFPNIRMTTRPVQRPFPMWVGGFGQNLVTRAGREGYHLQGGGPHVQAYLQALRDNGHDPDHFNYQLFGSGHLAATRDQAWDEVQEGLAYHRGFYEQRKWIAHATVPHPMPLLRPEELRHDPNVRSPVGSPDEVLRMLEPTLKDSRVTHYGFGFRHVAQSTEVVRRSMDLFAREILPVLKTWGRQPVKSGRGAALEHATR